MNLFETEPTYWSNFWKEENDRTINDDLQKQVGRTVNKKPVDPDIWNKTLQEIIKVVNLTDEDEIVDLCSGNGLISMPLSKKCKHVTAVDISKKLLDNIDTTQYANITKIEGDIRTVQFPNNSFSKAIIYFSIQYFTERETILILQSIYNWLKPGGLLFIGDIPDMDKIFVYFNTIERQKCLFDSILAQQPIIGNWFNKSFLEKMANYIGFKNCLVIEQPPFQSNAHYRYDVLLEK